MPRYTLLSAPDSNAKLAKSTGLGYYPVGLSLAPHSLSGFNVCPHATPGCVVGCVFGAGLAGVFPKIVEARIRKTQRLFAERGAFMDDLWEDIQRAHLEAVSQDLRLALRLNVFSDLDWRALRHPDGWTIFDKLDTLREVEVYDYTKSVRRANRELSGAYQTRWTTILSRSEVNESQCLEFLRNGGSVSVVFQAPKHQLPSRWKLYPVVDGDTHDLLFLRPANRVIGLAAKGNLRTGDTSGFSIPAAPIVGW